MRVDLAKLETCISIRLQEMREGQTVAQLAEHCGAGPVWIRKVLDILKDSKCAKALTDDVWVMTDPFEKQ